MRSWPISTGEISHGKGAVRFLAHLLTALLLAGQVCGCGKGDDQPEGGAAADSAQTLRRPDAARGAKVVEQLRVHDNAAAGGDNQPPRARIEVLPPGGWVGLTTFTFDASLSSDAIDRSAQLRKRWDFDGDGTWDIPFTSRPRIEHAFKETGTFRPRLEVVDRGGALDSVVGDPIEIRPLCPPPDFALADANANSITFGKTFSLEEQRGRRVLVWYASPSK